MNCLHHQVIGGIGGRLCTQDEVKVGATSGTGCGMDNEGMSCIVIGYQ